MEKSPLSLHKYCFDSITCARNMCERFGQCMFNHLYEVRPLLAEAVSGTDMDPYHVNLLSHPNWDRFISFIESHWNDPKFL